MILIIDIGNTNITCAVFKQNDIIYKFSIKSNIATPEKVYSDSLKKQLIQYSITKCAIASVVPELNNIVKNIIDTAFHINSIIIDNNFYFGINIKTPDSVGIDRVANAVYASKMYKFPAIVVDSGSATTFDIIDKNGDFIGGIIAPGIKTQLKSLHEHTAKLPMLDIEHISQNINAIGQNTETAMLSGVILGTACAIEGLINECKKELDEKTTVIGTGGFALLLSKYMTKPFDIIDPEFTLKGIKTIFEINN